MQEPDRPTEQIKQIHDIMARSTTFVSLSGVSGLSAGIIAFGALWQLYRLLGTVWLTEEVFSALRGSTGLVGSVMGVFLWTLVIALTVAFYFTWHRAKRNSLDLWNMASRRFALHLALPLLAGGIFVLVLHRFGTYELICPAMLVFFGLALMNAGKYSFSETVVLGTVELALGLAAALWIEAGLVLWALGFGVATMVYGALMFVHYER